MLTTGSTSMFAPCTTAGTLKHALTLLLTPVIAYMYVLILLLTVDRRHAMAETGLRWMDRITNVDLPARERAVTDEDESSESVKSAL